MDGQELEYMKKSLFEKRDLRTLCTDPTWLLAFSKYNVLNKPRLSTNCISCYMKVYLYHKNNYDSRIL